MLLFSKLSISNLKMNQIMVVVVVAAICILVILVGCYTYFITVRTAPSVGSQTNGQEHSERLHNAGHLEMMNMSHESSPDEDTTDAHDDHDGTTDEDQELEEAADDVEEEYAEVELEEDENLDSPPSINNPFC